MISEDPGAASQIVLDWCFVAEGPAHWLDSKGQWHLVGRLAECSWASRQKLFEMEFLSAIDVVGVAPFGELYCIFGLLSELVPLSLAPSTFEPCEQRHPPRQDLRSIWPGV